MEGVAPARGSPELDFDHAARESVAYIAARREAEREASTPAGDYVFVRTIETLASTRGQAVQVPTSLFDGPRDERWRIVEDGLVCVRCAKGAGET